MKRILLGAQRNLWGWCFAILVSAGLYSYYERAVLGPAIYQRELFPWDLAIGLNVLCGIALCAGGFTVAATLRILSLDNYRPLLRACLLIGFVGYVVAILGFLTSAGPSYRIGLLITWNQRLAASGAVWLLLLYAAVVLLEFAPELSKRFGWSEPTPLVHRLSLFLLLIATVLSVLQQTSFADLLIGREGRISPLWSGPQLPFLFFVSAACAALATVIFASWHTRLAFSKGLPTELTPGIGKALAAMLFFYLGLRCADFLARGIPLVVQDKELPNLLLGIEFILFFTPMWMLITEPDVPNPRVLYYCSIAVLAGLITNRLDTCITSVEAGSGVSYLPDWKEFMIAYSVVAVGIAIFGIVSKRLPVFSDSAVATRQVR